MKIEKENIYIIKNYINLDNSRKRVFLLIAEIGNKVVGVKVSNVANSIPDVSDICLIEYSKEEFEQYKISKYDEEKDYDFFYTEQINVIKEQLVHSEKRLKEYDVSNYNTLKPKMEVIKNIIENTSNNITKELEEEARQKKEKSIKQLSKRYRILKTRLTNLENRMKNIKKDVVENQNKIKDFKLHLEKLKENNEVITPEKLFMEYFN